VSSITRAADGRLLVEAGSGDAAPLEADAVVLAVGATSAAKLTEASPALAALEATRPFAQLRGITCVAVRLYLAPAAVPNRGLRGGTHTSSRLPAAVARAMADSPVLVVGPGVGDLPELLETGFCVYDLERLHDEHAEGELAVLEVDFYRADTIAAMEDDEAVAALALRAAAAALGVAPSVLPASLIIDKAVVRARNAVSHFAVGSAALSPGVVLGDGVYACGDWIDRSGHASWSTEKAVVTGRQAALALGRDMGLRVVANVLPAPEETEQLQALRKVAGGVRMATSSDELPPPAPWAALRWLPSLLSPARAGAARSPSRGVD